MQYLVPKFIEREPKIVGPLRFKQLLFLGGGALLLFVLYFFLSGSAFWVAIVIIAIVTTSLAFLRPNNRPLSVFAKSIFKYIIGPKIYLWKRKKVILPIPAVVSKKESPKVQERKQKDILAIAPLSRLSRLKNKLDLKKT